MDSISLSAVYVLVREEEAFAHREYCDPDWNGDIDRRITSCEAYPWRILNKTRAHLP